MPGQTVTFTSTSMPSAGSSITKIEWNLDAISGFAKQGSVATHAFPTAGVHTVQIKVTEDSGGVDIATADIVVNAASHSPDALFAQQPYAGDMVSFASLSRDADGYLASETWDLDGDGQFDDARGKVASRAFTTVGAHTVRLRAVDSSGRRGGPRRHDERAREAGRAAAAARAARPDRADHEPPGKSSTRITRARHAHRARARWSRRCKGKGCPRPRASSTRSRGKAVRLHWLERRLPAGTRIRIYVTAKGKIGSYTSLLIRRSKLPSRRDLCLPARDDPRPSAAPDEAGTARTRRCLGLVLALSLASARVGRRLHDLPASANPNQPITVSPTLTPVDEALDRAGRTLHSSRTKVELDGHARPRSETACQDTYTTCRARRR